MRNEDWEMEYEDSLREQAYLQGEKDYEYQCFLEEQELVRREAKISVRMDNLIVMSNDRIDTDS